MLSQEQILLRDTTRSFAQTHLAPRAAQRDRDGHAPRAMLNELAALGYLGMLLPAQWGGTELDYVSYAIAIAEIAAADGACSTTVSVHNSLACRPILNFGDEGQKQLYLPAMARGDMLGAFCLTEPEAGSDASALRTRARRDGDHYVLNGTKQFITSGSSADIAVVFAVTDPQAGKRGISAFIVQTDTPGYEIASIERTMGQRGWDHCQIVFRDCRIPAKNLLGDEGQGLTIALSNLETGRIGVAAQAFGMARAAYEFALAYAGERRSFGKAIFEHQAVAFRLADMATQLQAAELMILAAAQLRDAGLPCLKEASMAKLFATEMAERICSDAMQTLGGYGYLADFPLERLYRDVRVQDLRRHVRYPASGDLAPDRAFARGMIARFWRGWALAGKAHLYRRHFREIVRPHVEALPGFRSAWLLEKRENGEVEFLAVTHWQSLESVKAFAGDDVSVAKVEPQARAVLSRFETTATHYRIDVS